MNACVVCGKGHNTSSVVCSQECERRRYPYSHHGFAVMERMMQGMEPLGADFEKVWDENAERLYEK